MDDKSRRVAEKVFPELADGVEVDWTDVDEPELRWSDGSWVDTWRENYPFSSRMPRVEYDPAKRVLQIELLKLQYWVADTGQRVVIVFEGRDAAGKGGTIKRFTEHLDPCGARVVALGKPGERERGEWYFQRYVRHLPTAGEIVMFDRSWGRARRLRSRGSARTTTRPTTSSGRCCRAIPVRTTSSTTRCTSVAP